MRIQILIQPTGSDKFEYEQREFFFDFNGIPLPDRIRVWLIREIYQTMEYLRRWIEYDMAKGSY